MGQLLHQDKGKITKVATILSLVIKNLSITTVLTKVVVIIKEVIITTEIKITLYYVSEITT